MGGCADKTAESADKQLNSNKQRSKRGSADKPGCGADIRFFPADKTAESAETVRFPADKQLSSK